MRNCVRPHAWHVVVPTTGSSAALRRIRQHVLPAVGHERLTVVVNRAEPHEDPASANPTRGSAEDLRLVYAQHGGASGARNRGLELDHCVLVFVDDDVRITRRAVEWLVDVVHRAPGIATARVLPVDAGPGGVWDEFGFDRGRDPRAWQIRHDSQIGPMEVWDFGVGAMFSVGPRCQSGFADVRFDERLSNGTPFGGTEDIDYFYQHYLAGSVISYASGVVVYHDFPLQRRAISVKILRYFASDGAFYCKWRSRLSRRDVLSDVRGWGRRLRSELLGWVSGRRGVPLGVLIGEPFAKLAGVLWWLARRYS